MTKKQHIAKLFGLAIVAMLLMGFGKPKHSAVETKQQIGDDKNITFEFKVVPKNEMAINLEGPWQLKVKDFEGLNFASDTLKRNDLKEDTASFTLKTASKAAKESGKLSYRLTAFVCTEDKSKCFREVHKGELDWTMAAK